MNAHVVDHNLAKVVTMEVEDTIIVELKRKVKELRGN